MTIQKPYHRLCRQFTDGHYAHSGKAKYLESPSYALFPERYIRAFLLIQKDLIKIFDYVEPSDLNLKCYSYRLNEIILRSCIEFEANCKAILIENGYSKNTDYLSIKDYEKINLSHRLSSYKVLIPYWTGKKNIRTPFRSWGKNGHLCWYQIYNDIKHNRHESFPIANLNTALDSICGLLVILSAQFYTNDFSSSASHLIIEGPDDGSESAIGDYFRIFFPTDWPKSQRYDFDWPNMLPQDQDFQKYKY